MNKYNIIVSLLFLCLLSCNSIKDDPNPYASLSDTMWTSANKEYVMVLEFGKGNEVSFFTADSNMNILSSKVYRGSYVLNEDKITFDLEGAYYVRFRFNTATISGNNMEVEYEEWTSVLGIDSTPIRFTSTFRKK